MKIVKTKVEFGRGGSLNSFELITENEYGFFQYAMKNELTLYLGEVNGKHSDVDVMLEQNDDRFKFIDIDDDKVDFLTNVIEMTSFGDVCFSDEIKTSVFKHFGSMNDIDCEVDFADKCYDYNIIKTTQLDETLIASYNANTRPNKELLNNE